MEKEPSELNGEMTAETGSQERPVRERDAGPREKAGRPVRQGSPAGNRRTGSKTGAKTGSKAGSKTGTNAGSKSRSKTGSKKGTEAKHSRAKSMKYRTGRKQPVIDSFRHAFDGLFVGLTERNMKIHCTMAALVVFFGLLLRISVTEWCICFVLFGLIMGLELVNTSVEAVVDLVTKEYRPLAKRAKDTAAGAVLIASIMAAITGLIIFVPRLLYVLRGLF